MSRIAALKNIVGKAVRGFGKAIKAQKRKARRKRLGLPAETYLQRQKRIKKAGQKKANQGIRGYKR